MKITLNEDEIIKAVERYVEENILPKDHGITGIELQVIDSQYVVIVETSEG